MATQGRPWGGGANERKPGKDRSTDPLEGGS